MSGLFVIRRNRRIAPPPRDEDVVEPEPILPPEEEPEPSPPHPPNTSAFIIPRRGETEVSLPSESRRVPAQITPRRTKQPKFPKIKKDVTQGIERWSGYVVPYSELAEALATLPEEDWGKLKVAFPDQRKVGRIVGVIREWDEELRRSVPKGVQIAVEDVVQQVKVGPDYKKALEAVERLKKEGYDAKIQYGRIPAIPDIWGKPEGAVRKSPLETVYTFKDEKTGKVTLVHSFAPVRITATIPSIPEGERVEIGPRPQDVQKVIAETKKKLGTDDVWAEYHNLPSVPDLWGKPEGAVKKRGKTFFTFRDTKTGKVTVVEAHHPVTIKATLPLSRELDLGEDYRKAFEYIQNEVKRAGGSVSPPNITPLVPPGAQGTTLNPWVRQRIEEEVKEAFKKEAEKTSPLYAAWAGAWEGASFGLINMIEEKHIKKKSSQVAYSIGKIGGAALSAFFLGYGLSAVGARATMTSAGGTTALSRFVQGTGRMLGPAVSFTSQMPQFTQLINVYEADKAARMAEAGYPSIIIVGDVMADYASMFAAIEGMNRGMQRALRAELAKVKDEVPRHFVATGEEKVIFEEYPEGTVVLREKTKEFKSFGFGLKNAGEKGWKPWFYQRGKPFPATPDQYRGALKEFALYDLDDVLRDVKYLGRKEFVPAYRVIGDSDDYARLVSKINQMRSPRNLPSQRELFERAWKIKNIVAPEGFKPLEHSVNVNELMSGLWYRERPSTYTSVKAPMEAEIFPKSKVTPLPKGWKPEFKLTPLRNEPIYLDRLTPLYESEVISYKPTVKPPKKATPWKVISPEELKKAEEAEQIRQLMALAKEVAQEVTQEAALVQRSATAQAMTQVRELARIEGAVSLMRGFGVPLVVPSLRVPEETTAGIEEVASERKKLLAPLRVEMGQRLGAGALKPTLKLALKPPELKSGGTRPPLLWEVDVVKGLSVPENRWDVLLEEVADLKQRSIGVMRQIQRTPTSQRVKMEQSLAQVLSETQEQSSTMPIEFSQLLSELEDTIRIPLSVPSQVELVRPIPIPLTPSPPGGEPTPPVRPKFQKRGKKKRTKPTPLAPKYVKKGWREFVGIESLTSPSKAIKSASMEIRRIRTEIEKARRQVYSAL